MTSRRRFLVGWLAVGVCGVLLVPWYALPDTVLSLSWVGDWSTPENAPAVAQAARHGRVWLAPMAVVLAAIALALTPGLARNIRTRVLIASGLAGAVYLVAQGFAIGPAGWNTPALAAWLGPLPVQQGGMGLGACLTFIAMTMVLSLGLAEAGYFRGDSFVAGSVVGLVVLLGVFTFYPVIRILLQAFHEHGALSFSAFLARLFTAKLWGIGCLAGSTRCGVAWNTLVLAGACAACSTALGLAFALIATRTQFRFKRMLRLLSALPVITPPFVIGLGLILLFGRSGLVNQFLEWSVGLPPARWIYGMQGILVAQIFAFTPIAFLVLIGVVESVSPSLEEAAHTLRADRWRTFVDVSLPLMRPGLANAALITFIESIADFGNPILLGGDFAVLSTEIFFAVVGAQLDPGRAAALGIVLLLFALGAFVVQRRMLHDRVYTSISGRGDPGSPTALPTGVRRACYAVAVPWAALTIVIYAMALAGGFVENWGRDYTPTLAHYVKAFGVEWGDRGLVWTGAAWNSFWTTVQLSAIAAPLTAGLGILAAWLLSRQHFAGQSLLEFGTMLSFAIPGTVIGVAYVLAFNVPPIEMTGTALILVACNVFRNMPVGVRAGMASMAQIDRSLDEASTTLGADSATTLRRVLFPLLKPAVVAALVYSFVRAMTTVSAVIFLVSAQYEWATTYIINRVINGDYGVAIAYSSVLIVLMLGVIAIIAWLVGERRVGRRNATPALSMSQLGSSAA